MIAEPIAAARQVATKTESRGMPDTERISGLTKMIYAMVRKVVTPAMISVRTVVPCSESLKKRSSMICFPKKAGFYRKKIDGGIRRTHKGRSGVSGDAKEASGGNSGVRRPGNNTT